MTTRHRVEALAKAVAEFPEMGDFGKEEELWELVRTEWPDSAIPPRCILHIISANTAMAGMQSLVRGLILGSHNLCKTPGVGLPRFVEFVERLPGALRSLVKVSPTLPDEWLAQADAVIVFGNDETVETFRKRTRQDQIFAGYGNRWSGAVIFSDDDFSSIAPLVHDICPYEQMGCLSAQIVWLHESVDALEYGKRLAASLTEYVFQNQPPTLNLAEAASVARWRLSAEWKSATGEGNRVWFSPGEPVWGVLLLGKNESPGLSCLHRHVTLQTFSDAPDLGELASSVSTLGFHPTLQQTVPGVSRFCPVGEMQFPKPTWQQDGFPALGRLLGKTSRL